MKNTLRIILALLCSGMSLSAQTLTPLHTVNFPFITNGLGEVGSSDCWGWTSPTGVDYAIVGNHDNVAVVRASDGMVMDQIDAPDQLDGYYHRDMVTYQQYCYVVAEMTGTNEGLMVLDLSTLPDSVTYVGSFTFNGSMVRSHNLDVDTATAHLYIEGDGSGGVEIIDISNPVSPVKVGFVSAPNVHDIHARNDTLWVAEGYSKAYSVWDVSDKNNPVNLANLPNGSFGYCHNIWPSDDGKFFFTTEETTSKTVKVWDATDMNNITLRGQYLAPNALAHNVHVMGNYLFISHYTSGVVVVDWSDPDNPVEVAAYDTYPQNNVSDFFGCWGAFPYTQNGYVYASNFAGELFILEWDPLAVGLDAPAERSDMRPWPNPVQTVTNIPLELAGAGVVSVQVLDMQGRQVATAYEGELDAGRYTLPWHPAADLDNGVYFILVRTGTESRTEKIVLSR